MSIFGNNDPGCVQNCQSPCGGSITFSWDDTLFYPTSISLVDNPNIADGGIKDINYTLGCLTVFTNPQSIDLTNYNGDCEAFPTLPQPGNVYIIYRIITPHIDTYYYLS